MRHNPYGVGVWVDTMPLCGFIGYMRHSEAKVCHIKVSLITSSITLRLV